MSPLSSMVARGRGIVHDALAAVGAGEIVVREAERVPDLVRGQLPDARERHLHRVGVAGDLGQVLEVRSPREHARLPVGARLGAHRDVEVAAPVVGGDPARERRHHPLPVQVVLAQPQAPQVHHPAHDLAGARIDHRVAVRVAARPPVGPVDHVVADVLRIDPLGQHFDPVGVDEAGLLEGLGPPLGPLDERAPHRLGRARIHIVDDGLDRLGALRVRVPLLQAMAGHPADAHVLVDGTRVVAHGRPVHPDARIGDARFVTGPGQLDEGMVLPDREGAPRGRDPADQVAGRVAREREHRLDLGVLREGLGVGQIDGAAGHVQLELPLPPLRDLGDDPRARRA